MHVCETKVNGRARIANTATNSQFMAKVDLLDVITKMTMFWHNLTCPIPTPLKTNVAIMYNNIIVFNITTFKF